MVEPDDNRTRRQLHKSSLTTTDEQKKNNTKENNNERLSLPTHHGDVTVDPVNEVSFFFDDESMFLFTFILIF